MWKLQKWTKFGHVGAGIGVVYSYPAVILSAYGEDFHLSEGICLCFTMPQRNPPPLRD